MLRLLLLWQTINCVASILQRMHSLPTPDIVLQAGLSLSMRNVLSIVILLYATTLVTGLGSVTLAAHEILRQVWIFAIQ